MARDLGSSTSCRRAASAGSPGPSCDGIDPMEMGWPGGGFRRSL